MFYKDTHPRGNLHKVCVCVCFLPCMEACCMWQRGERAERGRRHRGRSKVDTLTAVFDSPVSLRKARTHTLLHTTGVTAQSTEFTLIRLLVFPSLRQEIFEAFIKLLIYLFIHLVSQSVSHVFFMAEKLSVISLSYQMVEGLINNFKSNNWRAGQIHRHTHSHRHTHNISCLCKSPAQAHIIHLLIHAARKSNRKRPLYSQRVYVQFLFSSLWRLLGPRSPACLCRRWLEWRGGAVDGLGAPRL